MLLERFMDMLCGTFDNEEQLRTLEEKGITNFPKAEHVNTDCTDLICDLPEDFTGKFVLEESYYHVGERTNVMPHLFLIREENEKITLYSFDMPKGYTKESFCYKNLKEISYKELSLSKKFTPIVYEYKEGAFEGCSVSMFSPVTRFTLKERFTEEVLEVSEIMEVNGVRTLGYDVPIEYRRV